MRYLPTALLLAAVTLLAAANPASAHTQLIGSDPAEGASLPVAPQQIRLTFNEPVQTGFSTVTVTGPDGMTWIVGQPEVHNTVVSVPVQPTGPPGQYTIGYRVLSDDGHPVSGTVRFALSNPAAAPPTTSSPLTQTTPAPQRTQTQAAPTTHPDNGGMPLWPWIVGVVVLLGIGLAIALRIGRSTDT
ncbi:copper resistance protein CopC [Amycolatopsis sp. NPDC006131]|uniref:copper resistance CopC family protein n=1 Tax=Amycolatopsis sp. NPDC006131 TaxID=3156731 RepID=UPI00339DD539